MNQLGSRRLHKIEMQEELPPPGGEIADRESDPEEDDDVRRVQKERDDVWKKAVESRRQYVTFDAPPTWQKQALQNLFEKSPVFEIPKQPDQKSKKQHRLFLFSADLLQEGEDRPWKSLPEWKMASHVMAMEFVNHKPQNDPNPQERKFDTSCGVRPRIGHVCAAHTNGGGSDAASCSKLGWVHLFLRIVCLETGRFGRSCSWVRVTVPR